MEVSSTSKVLIYGKEKIIMENNLTVDIITYHGSCTMDIQQVD